MEDGGGIGLISHMKAHMPPKYGGARDVKEFENFL